MSQGNIGVHSRSDQRYICHVCKQTFTASKGTAFYRLHKARSLMMTVITLLAYGCPAQAIVAAFGLDERTVYRWLTVAGRHCATVHKAMVEQPRDLGHVQADELRVKKHGGLVWIASALQVPTRLWLGGVVGPQRDMALITALIANVKAAALARPVLFCVDGWWAYVGAVRSLFRNPLPSSGSGGRPRFHPWPDVYLAQVVKQYTDYRVVGVTRRIVQGTVAQVTTLLTQTHGGQQINTAYIERLHATFRSRLAPLVRQSRAPARQTETLQHGLALVGAVYNFCTPHKSLRLMLYLPHERYRWVARTPAVAAGLTDQRWPVETLLGCQVPLPRWEPTIRRGRVSATTKDLIARWCT